MSPRPDKSPIGQLKFALEVADEILVRRKLHKRTKNLELIEDPVARDKERRRQNFSIYVGERFEWIVTDTLRSLEQSEELLYIFNYIDLAGQSKTSANILELQMQKVKEIISLLERHPDDYKSKLPLDKNSSYDRSTGIITQFTKTIESKDKAKELIDYLWGKRHITYSDRSPAKSGRGVSVNAIINNTSITNEARLKSIIDNFNAQCRERATRTRIKKDRLTKLVQLHVFDEFPARKL